MSTRRRFSKEVKAKVALEALRGDKTIQRIAARHKVLAAVRQNTVLTNQEQAPPTPG